MSRAPIGSPAAVPQDWTESGAFEVAAGVYRIPLPLPSDALKAVNVYAIADGERVVLVIAGEDLDGTDWEPPDHWIKSGDEFALYGRTLRSIHTPGHTRGHVVFVEAAAGVLFAGDDVLPHITPSIGFESTPSAPPLADYLTSLQLMQTMPDVRLLPAHGPVTDSVHNRVDELLEHHAVRLDARLAAVPAGADAASLVAGQLGWTRRNRRLADLDVFNSMLEIIAHYVVS